MLLKMVFGGYLWLTWTTELEQTIGKPAKENITFHSPIALDFWDRTNLPF